MDMTKQWDQWSALDIEHMEPMQVTDIEKARVKKRVIGNQRGKSVRSIWRNVAAAVLITGTSMATLGIAFPGVAAQIPFMQGIFSYFETDEDNFYTKYGDHATAIEQVQTSNGVTVMIENAVYDGASVTIAYALETEKELGETPYFSFGQALDVQGSDGFTGENELQKISDTRYAGVIRLTPVFEKQPDTVQVQWAPDSFTNSTTNQVLTGDWSFNFQVTQTENEVQVVNQAAFDKGVTLLINELRNTEVSTVIDYDQIIDPSLLEEWKDISPLLEVKDDLGNDYQVKPNGGMSEDSETYEWSDTIGIVDPKATKLYIEPTLIFSLGEGKGHEKHKMETIAVDLH
jgi:hypothetical protein